MWISLYTVYSHIGIFHNTTYVANDYIIHDLYSSLNIFLTIHEYCLRLLDNKFQATCLASSVHV